jgi:hypothetical protein|nr:MAG TPA: minor structural protein [Herelleviridae sp.]
MKKNKYEISLWEDRLVPQTGEGQSIVPEHYEEEKVCIIGSDTMTSQARVLEPKLVRNVNGTNKLTFKLYYTYIDNETGEKVQNPFISLLVNERKVKCKWEDHWYDFVIKGIQEDSNGKTITYTCEDLYINELSKTGFSLEFDQKLNNNQGTAQELAKKVLEGTDWVVDIDNSDHILQTIEEPLYSATLTQDLDVKDKNDVPKKILGGSVIYLFYSVVQEKKSYIQFIYNTSYETESNSQLLKENNCYSVEMDWSVFEALLDGNMGIVFSDYRGKRLVRKQLQEFNSALNRNCYVYKDQSNNKVLGYSTVEYKDPTVVLNLISNSKEFINTNGWQGDLNWQLYPLFYNKNKLEQTYTSTTYLKTGKNKVVVFNNGLYDSAGYLENGLQPGQHYYLRVIGYSGEPKNGIPITDGISVDIQDYFNALSTQNTIPVHNTLRDDSYCSIVATTTEDYYFITPDTTQNKETTYYIRNSSTGKYETRIFDKNNTFPGNQTLYEKKKCLQIEIEIKKARPRKEITAGYFGKYHYKDSEGNIQTKISTARPGLFISLPGNSWIQEVQFYQRVEGYNGAIIHIGDFDTQSIGIPYYKYFIPNDSYKKEEDIKYLYCGTTKKTDLIEIYKEKDDNTTHVLYEKIRSITAKNSNRFNILQSIAETFQCWIRFKIFHNENTGKIIYENGIPKKTVYFKEEVGKDLGYGFVYGIDLKTISRSIDSNQLTTKVVVAPNTTEYAENGICRIADADLNENGENYILDFGYYISQGLLNSGELNKYLYQPENGKSGFYIQLKKLNNDYIEIISKLTAKKTELTKQKSLQVIYDQYVTNSATEITTLKNNLCQLTGFANYREKEILNYLNKHSDNTEAVNTYSSLINTQHQRENNQASLKLIEKSVENLTTVIKEYDEKLKEIIKNKEILEKAFYQKFSRFIQEGSWTSQDYIDPNLYYLDARSVAYTSSRPKISYNISVIRLNALDEYKGKKFNVGDISFIEDKEFFGYIKGEDAWKTPYHEKVLISESTSWLDSPEKDIFTIQNYKTQFEDLFQRITATTQSLQYSTGEYNRASNIVEGKGVINTETLQNSININNELVFKSQNEEIFQDSTGLTLTDKRDPSKRTKLTSGGLFISTDGGVTWKNAVRGEGVATQYLTSGSINTNNIAIYDGAHASFRWDKYGINAYDATREIDEATNQEVLKGIVTNNFVRFDQYGVYGIKGIADDPYNPQKEVVVDGKTIVGEDRIWHDALFGMTWKGFFLKSKGTDNQQIEISTTNDICVTKDKVERIKIGRIDSKKEITEDGEISHDIYGLRLKDNTGITTMETDDNGQLWLRDKLQIAGAKYVGTSDSKIIEGKIYYIKNENGTFSEVQNPITEELSNYFELATSGVSIGNLGQKTENSPNQIFNSNNNFIVYENGSIFANNGVFNGQINATSGSFTGEINATSGTFTGEINALSGNIGGFTIEDEYLEGSGAILSPEGITIKNDGRLSIFDSTGVPVFQANTKTYVLTSDTIVEENKKYFKVNEDGAYEEDTSLKVGDPLPANTYEEKTITQFSGKLVGASGSFSGDLTATSGHIGGFIISEEKLESVSKKDNGETNIILDGTNGNIMAENISLGNGAEVKDQISFKGADETVAYLQNPILHDGVVLSAGELKLKTSGLLEFGDIKISGDDKNPTIHSSLWSIDKDKAIFNNVIAQGGTIENVVFKNSSVQSAGGLMIFKPSFTAHFKSRVYVLSNDTIVLEGKQYFTKTESGAYEITTIKVGAPVPSNTYEITSTYTFIIEDNAEMSLTSGDHILVEGTEGIINSVSEKEVYIDFSNDKLEFSETCSITKLYSSKTNINYTLTTDSTPLLGKIYYKLNGNDYIEVSFTEGEPFGEGQYYEKQIRTILDDSVLIGISSIEPNSINSIATDCHLFRSGLTVTAPIISSEGKASYPKIPNLFLGDLTAIGKSGYGLYGDNVYLNGTLTTQVPSEGLPTYAGVNTLSGVQKSDNDTQKIVFWAGSSSDKAEAIREAPFQVTDKGNLYAKAGTFTDSVFTDSTITGSQIYGADIYTASIHGWNKDQNQSGGLSIYNTSQGIIFKTEKDINGEEKVLFQINGNKFSTPNKDFISISENNIVFSGNEYQIFPKIKIQTKDTTLVEGKTYYKKNEDGSYVIVEVPNQENITTYYEELESEKEKFSLADKKLEFLGKDDTNNWSLLYSGIYFSQTDILNKINGESKLLISNEKISSYEAFEAQKDIFFGRTMEYRAVKGKIIENGKEVEKEIGYNLYIK